MKNKIKTWFFYNIRLRIGRLERCSICNKIIWNRTECLYDSLYYERQGCEVYIAHNYCDRNKKNNLEMYI